jgi:hypothetical protein
MVANFTILVKQARTRPTSPARGIRDSNRPAATTLPSRHAFAKTAKLRVPDGKFGAHLEPLGEAREMS